MTSRPPVAGPGELVLASANPDKAREIADLLAGVDGLVLLPRPPEVPEVEETGVTLEENAHLKAAALAAATGRAAVADDTGLEVDALGGAPGVYSARYAGEHAAYADNVAKLLAELDAVGAADPPARRARFRTVATVVRPDGTVVSADGEVTGTIAIRSAGVGGFGYDPIFVPDGGDGRTFAQMDPAEKHRLSHRGRAFRALAAALREEDGRSGPAQEAG